MTALALLLALGAPAADGATIYATRCATCHGSEGRGDGPMGLALQPRPADLTDVAFWTTRDRTSIETAIAGGGTAVQRSPAMPAWDGVLTDASLGAVASYVADAFYPLPQRFTLSLYARGADGPAHLAVVFDGSKADVYEDGRLTETLAPADPDPLSLLWRIATEDTAEVWASHAYDRSMTEAEVQALAACVPSPAPALQICGAGQCGCATE